MKILKSCPFCGGDAELNFNKDTYKYYHRGLIYCKECGATSESIELYHHNFNMETDLVVKTWNRRVGK